MAFELDRLFHPFGLLIIGAIFASPATAAEPNRREKGDRAIKARAILRKYCYECHGGKESRGTILALDHSRLVASGPNPVPFVLPRNAADSQIIQFLEDGSMPPGGRERPKPDEIALLKQWIAESATSFPAAFDEQTTLRVMLDDLATLPETDVPHIRYFSFAHLISEDGKLPDLGAAELELQKALLWCGIEKPPEPVDGTATLFRFDTRQAGWDDRELFLRVRKGAEGVFPLSPYDLLLLEYPHASRLSPDNPLAKRLGEYMAKAKLVRPVPFLRADWVAGMLKLGSPLADDMKSLTELHKALENDGKPAVGQEKNPMPCGPKPRAFAGLNPVPAFPKLEPARPILPLWAYYGGSCQVEPPTIKLTAEALDQNGKPLKKPVAKGEPFQLHVTTDQKAYFVLLMVWSDGQVKVMETRNEGFMPGGEHFLGPKTDEAKPMFRITGILTGDPKATEYFVLLASSEELPPPVLVRSRHALSCDNPKRSPVYRFLFDPDAKFEQSRVIRKVIPITVTAAKLD
jgi:Planctomycete cytochrome C